MLSSAILILVMAFVSALFVLFLSAVLESVLEYVIGIPADYLPWLARHKGWIIPLAGAISGVTGAFVYGLDMLFIFGQFLDGVALELLPGAEISLGIPLTIFGKISTGLLISRGSNAVHELIKKWFNLSDMLKKWQVFGEPEPQE